MVPSGSVDPVASRLAVAPDTVLVKAAVGGWLAGGAMNTEPFWKWSRMRAALSGVV